MKILGNRIGLRVALLYALFGGVWILFSDRLLFVLVDETDSLTALQTYKGWAFVAVSALFIYTVLKRELIFEGEFHQSEERYRLLIENSMDAILLTAPDGSILTVNPAACLMFGWTEEEIKRRGRGGLMDAADPRWEAALEERAQTGRFRGELNFLRADGSQFPAEVSTNIFQFKDGSAGTSMIIRDISERKRAEAAVLESEARYHRVLDAMMEGCQIIDFDWRYVYVNDVVAAQGKRSREDLLGHTMMEMYPGIENTELFAVLRRCMEDRAPQRMENQFVFPDGSLGWFELSIQPAQEGVFILSTDITERKRMDNALRDSEERYRLLFESNPLPMWVYDIETLRFLAVNEAAASHYGYGRDEFLSMTIKDIRPPEEIPSLLTNLSESHQSQQRSGPWKHRKKDGTLVDVEILSHETIFMNRAARLVLANDITERRKAEEQLRYQAHLLENINDAIVASDADYFITAWNAAAEKMYGWAADEVIGRKGTTILQTQFPNAGADEMRRQIAESGQFRGEVTQLRKDGARIFVEVATIVLKDDSGKIISYVSVNRDITERERAEEQFRAVVESAPDAILLVDKSGRISLVNAQAERYFGYNRSELLAFSIDQLVPRRFRSPHAGFRTAFFSEPQMRPMGAGRDLYGLRKDGSEFPVEIGLTPIEMQEGLLVMATVVDITARKKVEETLHQSEERFATIFRSSPTPIALTRLADAKTMDVNEAFCKLFGYSRTEAVGKTSLELGLVDPDAQQRRVELIRQTGMIRNMEIRVRDRHGKPLELLISIETINLGDEAYALTTMIDNTERKRAEERQEFLTSASKALASSLDYETTLTTVAQLAVPQIGDWCSIYLVAPDGSLEQVALTHKDPEKVKWARALQQRYPPNPNAPRGVGQVIRSGQAEFMPEIPAEMLEPLKKDPETSRILDELQLTGAMTVPLTLHDRALGAISLISAESRLRYTAEDLALAEELARRAAVAVENARLYHAAQKLNDELEQRVVERTVQLEMTNKELESFAYSVSHDLRAPLRSIDGFSHALMEDYERLLPPEGLDYLKRVRLAAQRMGELIDDLLGLSRVTRASVNRADVDLSRMAEEIAAELQNEQPERRVDFLIAPGLVVQADARLLRIALTNLLNNAFKFTSKKAEARIELGAQEQGGQRVFFVRDNGAGFEMTYVEKLFGAFQRLHSAREFSGTGIGLATVQRIFHKHGGAVWAEGALDEGATFYFTL